MIIGILRNFLCVLLLTVFTVSAIAETNTERLNFMASLELGFENSPRMIEARKAIESSQGDLLTSRTFRNPEAELEMGGFKKNDDG